MRDPLREKQKCFYSFHARVGSGEDIGDELLHVVVAYLVQFFIVLGSDCENCREQMRLGTREPWYSWSKKRFLGSDGKVWVEIVLVATDLSHALTILGYLRCKQLVHCVRRNESIDNRFVVEVVIRLGRTSRDELRRPVGILLAIPSLTGGGVAVAMTVCNLREDLERIGGILQIG